MVEQKLYNKISVEITEMEEGENPYEVIAENLKNVRTALVDISESGMLGFRNRAHIQNAIARVNKVEETFLTYAEDTRESVIRKTVKSKIADATPEQLEKIKAILG